MAYKTYNTPIQGTSAYHLRIGYKVLEQNQEANTSRISYKLEIIHSDTSQRGVFNNVGDASTWFKILGTTMAENKSFKYDFRRQSKILALEGTAIIHHRPSGVANVELQAYFDPALDGTGASLKATTATVLVELPKLPGRARGFIREESTVDIGQTFWIRVTEPVEGYSYKCEIVHDNKRYSFDPTTETYIGIKIPNDLLNRLADRTSAPVTVRMTTISGGEELGTTSNQATVTVPASLRPSIKSVKVQNSTSAHVAFFNSSVHFLGEQSTAKIQITPNSETHGARVVEYEVRVVDRHTKRATGTNAILSFKPFDFHRGGLKTYHIEGRVKDSRGRYSDWVESESLYVIEYKSPRLESIQVTREGSGTSAIVSRSYEVVELDIGEGPLNSAELTFYTRGVRADNWTKNAGAGSRSFKLKNSEAKLSGTFLATEGYEIKAVLKDHFSEVSTMVVLGTEAVPLDISKDGVGVGKMHEEGGAALQVHGGIEVSGGINERLLPEGTDLNDYKENGVFHEYMDIGARSLKNCPASEAFVMKVTATPTERFVYQEITTWNRGFRYVRAYYSQGGRWQPWNQIGFTDQPWTALSVQGGLQKDFNESVVFSVKNGVGYLKLHNVFFDGVHSGSTVQVSQLPAAYAPTRDTYISLDPAYWVESYRRMILIVRTNGNIDLIRNTHAREMMMSVAVPLI